MTDDPFIWDIEDDYYEQQAWFCLLTGIAPSEYDQMNERQLAAFIKVQKKINKQK